MVNGGDTRWQRLVSNLRQTSTWLLWLSPLMLMIDRVIWQDRVNLGWQPNVGSAWLIIMAWLLVNLGFYLKNRYSKSPWSQSWLLIIAMILLAAYIMMTGTLTELVAVVIFGMMANSLLHPTLTVMLANLIIVEITVVIIRAWLTSTVGQAFYILNILLLTIYCLTLLLLNLKKLDKQPSPKEVNEVAPAVNNSLTTLINNLNSGILRIKSDMTIDLYNAASLNILDTNVALGGRQLGEVLPLVDLSGKPFDLIASIKQAQRTEALDEVIYTYQNGEKIRLEITISPVKNNYGVNENQEYLLILRDVTKAKNLEQERDEFISVVSHELRTPIAIAEASLSNLALMLDRKTDKRILKQALAKSHDQIILLAAMMNDLSSLARANRTEIVEMESIDLRETSQAIYDKYTSQFADKKLQFDLDFDQKLTKIKTNRLYFEEIIQNLLTNALRYTPKGGVILAFKRRAGVLEVSVKDTGVGISKVDQEKIFEKFYRAEDFRTRETGGTGLGLYVARRLALKINGQLTVKSRLGFGSTFSLTLPLKK